MSTEQFREYVTGVAFNLQLSKPMCDAMAYFMREHYKNIEAKGLVLFVAPPMISTANSLERRGLIERRWDHGRTMYGNSIVTGGWRVTEAGKITFDLLVLAGLCQPLDVRAAA